MLIGAIADLWDSTPAAQQSVHSFLLCFPFHCGKVVTPNLDHSLQALYSLLLPVAQQTTVWRKKKQTNQTLAKNSFNCPSLHLYCFHSTHGSRQTKLVLLLFQTYTILQWWIMQLSIPFPKPSIHHTFLSMFLFHSRAFFFSPSAWDMCSKLVQNVKKKLSSIRLSKGWWGIWEM